MVSAAESATFFQIFVEGVGLGALYALVAMGFALIYKVTSAISPCAKLSTLVTL